MRKGYKTLKKEKQGTKTEKRRKNQGSFTITHRVSSLRKNEEPSVSQSACLALISLLLPSLYIVLSKYQSETNLHTYKYKINT